MREFKFRAWSEGKMHYSTQYQKVYGGVFIYSIGDGNYGEEKRVTDCIFMQFTGLKDKNGKEIYEGDILVMHGIPEMEGRVVSVIYKMGGFRDSYYMWIIEGKESNFEVIGNIYENPELLSQEGK